ncbi:MAG: polysaccharide biosynthesis C-terminal domain-containing protein [Eubacteriales bacterium]|nr:polysaccharide biosynthesis C-terminal domain-containing protein [Eubacteriales bacterium]
MSFDRKKKFVLNTITSVLNQILLLISGFLLPRAMLFVYGSEVNGLVSSISQFLGFISFMQAGVGAVVQAALYKPLADNDWIEVSKIYTSAQKFFRCIAVIFLFYTLLVAALFPFITDTPFNSGYVFLLVIAVSINLFFQYYFGLSNSLLLNADQKGYVSLCYQFIATLLNVIVSMIMIYSEASVLNVKLVGNIVCLIAPLGMYFYVSKNYRINSKMVYTEEPIKNKWSGFGQHISAVVTDNTDVIVLTLFSSLSNVSVYSVYHMIVSALRLFIVSLSNGIQSLFGNMLANNEHQQIKILFDRFEMAFAYLTTFLFSCAMCLSVNFVKVYTRNVTDANYVQPLFEVLISIAFAIFCYRTIYYTLIKAAGQFKETQIPAVIEAVLNILVSIIAVRNLGLVGVAVGTIVAAVFRTVHCAWYISKNIIMRPLFLFWKNMAANSVVYILTYLLTVNIPMRNETYISWLSLALLVSLVNFAILTLVYCLAYRGEFFALLRALVHKFR